MSEIAESPMYVIQAAGSPLPSNHETLRRRTSSDTEGDVQRVLGKLEKNGIDLTVLRVLANSPTLLRPFVLLSDALMHQSAISANLREVAILAMAARARTQYEWAEHVPMALAADLGKDQIVALQAGTADLPHDLFTDEQRLVVEVIHHVLDGQGVAADRWEAIMERWGGSGVLELVAIISWWGAFVPTMLGALGLVAPDVRPYGDSVVGHAPGASVESGSDQ